MGARKIRKALRARACARVLARDESGQAITEYILILSMAISVLIFMAKVFLQALDTGTLVFGAQLEKDMKSGRAALGIWKN